ncbi:hypothetical protein TNCV_5067571 [Trichonephila clavipes]|nr:hypothetical protein TNCV_5067571 [Trichonephila clavipes]
MCCLSNICPVIAREHKRYVEDASWVSTSRRIKIALESNKRAFSGVPRNSEPRSSDEDDILAGEHSLLTATLHQREDINHRQI